MALWTRRGGRARRLRSPRAGVRDVRRCRLKGVRIPLWTRGSGPGFVVGGLWLSGVMEARSSGRDRGRGPRRLRACSKPPPRPSAGTGWCSGEAPDRLRVVHAAPRHPESGTATWGDAGLPGLGDCDASLGGDGTPGVAPFVAEELGAAMGISTQSAMSLMADALDLRHRLPRLWEKVEALEVAPYKTRRVADDTRSLPLGAPAGWTSSSPPASTGSGCPTIERLVALAAARYAPEEQAEKEQESERAAPRHAGPPAPGRVRRHLLPGGRRRHPGPGRVLRPGLRGGQAPRPAR